MKTEQHKNMKSLWRPWMFCKFFANVCDEFFAISQGEDSSADGASSLWAHGPARWCAATHSGHGIGHIAWDFTRFHSLFIIQVKMAGPFQIRLFFWTEIATMYFSLIYTQTLVLLLQSTGHYIVNSKTTVFFPTNQAKLIGIFHLFWHCLTTARKIFFHTINEGKHPTLVGFSPSLWPIPCASTPQESGVSALFLGLTPTLAGEKDDKRIFHSRRKRKNYSVERQRNRRIPTQVEKTRKDFLRPSTDPGQDLCVHRDQQEHVW